MNGPGDEIVLMTVLPITIVFWGWVVWVILEWRKMRNKSKLQGKIVDKFSTAQEFNDFLQSKEGSRFLNFLKFNGRAPRERILSSLAKGIVLFFLGIAIIVVGSLFADEMRYFIAFGIVLIAIGLGFLVSTIISYKLSKKWGIIDEGS